MECPTAQCSQGNVPYNEFIRPDMVDGLAQRIVAGKSNCVKLSAIVSWVHNHIQYRYDQTLFGMEDFWLFPNEILVLRKEDCDGMSVLVCSMLRAIGLDAKMYLGMTPWGYHAWVETDCFNGQHYVIECTTGNIYTPEEKAGIGYQDEWIIDPSGCTYVGNPGNGL